MTATLLLVLTLTGLSSQSTNMVRDYFYINVSKTWSEAQSYCREMFTDLATVDNRKNNNKLLSVLQGRETHAWLGLYDNKLNWRWTMGNSLLNNSGFTNWEPGRPKRRDLSHICALMTGKGEWRDRPCGTRRASVCYHGQGPPMYIFVNTERNWGDSLRHCRENYTNLVKVTTTSQNNDILSQLTEGSWIGLQRKTWRYWSDKTRAHFYYWYNGQPNHEVDAAASCVVVNATTGRWLNVDCKEKNHFICQNVSYPVDQKNTFKLKLQSEANLQDPAVQKQILEQLHVEMKAKGLPDFKLRWIQTDGQTFRKEQQRKKHEDPSCG